MGRWAGKLVGEEDRRGREGSRHVLVFLSQGMYVNEDVPASCLKSAISGHGMESFLGSIWISDLRSIKRERERESGGTSACGPRV